MGKSPKEKMIEISHDPDLKSGKYSIHVLNEHIDTNGDSSTFEEKNSKNKVTLQNFINGEGNLPRYVFSYYSGESSRMHDVFAPYLQWYDEKLRKGEDPGIKRLFYALPVHSQFVLLAFLIGENNEILDFLKNNLGLGLDPEDGLESVLFVLRNPPWQPQIDGDPRFWGAKGIVSEFLSRLLDISLAPIDTSRRVPVSLWNKETLQFKYLYVKNIQALKSLVGEQSPAEFFRDLESTYVSQLIDEVRIKVKLRKSEENVTFRELSEGEQQLLTVLGLLKFTAEEESLFLLDEPDTHLNPRWSVDYLSYLKKVISNNSAERADSHILVTTHNPLAIAELVREQVQILQLKDENTDRRVVAFYPEVDPRGMGYAAIVASDMFGIASTLDYPTQILLEKQRILGSKKTISVAEQAELESLNTELNKLGFRFFHPDDEYSRYLRLRNQLLSKRFNSENTTILADKTTSLEREERENLANELIEQLLKDDNESDDNEIH